MPTPDQMGSALAIAQAIDRLIVPVFGGLILMAIGWGLGMTWMLRGTKQAVEGMATKIDLLFDMADKNRTGLEDHRREDAGNFAGLMQMQKDNADERVFWRKIMEDRLSATSRMAGG